MSVGRTTSISILAALALLWVIPAAGCHSYHIETAVENRTGGEIRLLEVDYPSASFGANNLAAGATFHYRIQLRGNGPIKVQYMASNGQQTQIEGPTVSEPQEGQLSIVLLPAGKTEFLPRLTQAP